MARKMKRAKQAKTAAPRRNATKPPNENALIRLCVVYTQSIGAYDNGFKADSDGDYEHAAALGNRHYNRAWQSLTKIAATPATTPEGLCSKARILPVMLKHNGGGSIESVDESFLISFSADVEKFLRPICNGQVTLQSAATEGGAS
jgi:hypothetical protein